MRFTVLQAIFTPYCITEEGHYMEPKQLFSFKSSNRVYNCCTVHFDNIKIIFTNKYTLLLNT